MRYIGCILILLLFASPLSALTVIENAPFSTGFGIDTTAGSGASRGDSTNVCTVDVLTDAQSGADGAGSDDGGGLFSGDLRYCIEEVAGPKTIIFEVSGTIDLGAKLICGGASGAEASKCTYVTIAGQTAPSPGITIKGEYLEIERNTHDILIQHLRFRIGEDGVADLNYYDGIVIDNHYVEGSQSVPYNVVIDHCSLSWAIDENIDLGSDDTTISNCIISEGLNESTNPKEPHSKGLITYATNSGIEGGINVAIVQNLFAHNEDRNPQIRSGSVAIANNLLYDFENGITLDDHGVNEGTQYSAVVGNYMIGTDIQSRWIYVVSNEGLGLQPNSRFWIDNTNYYNSQIQTSPWTTANQCADFSGGCTDNTISDTKRADSINEVVWPSGYTAMTAANAKTYVLANAGARPEDQDVVDARIITEVTGESGTSALIDSVAYTDADCTAVDTPMWCCTGSGTGTCVQNDETGWPSLATNTRTFPTPASWETVQGSGYTLLEELLHDYAGMWETTASTAILTGTCTENKTESEIAAGSCTIIITLNFDIWDDNIGADNAQSTALLAGVDGNGSGAGYWDDEVKANLTFAHLVRDSDRVATITIPSNSVNITETETITVTVPNTATYGTQETVSDTFTVAAELVGAESISSSYNANGAAGNYSSGGIGVTAP